MDIPNDSDLLAYIEGFLERTGMGHARFGVDATGEGGLVKSLRNGRSLSVRNAQRVLAFIREYDAANPASSGKSGDVTASVAA
jgi:hypothetical protein